MLTILLHRAFLEQGHLRRHSDDAGKQRGEKACIRSALMIEKYVRMYRNAFTLRRAPFLLSYAVYSSVAVILNQEQLDRAQFTDTISFFWTCLHELQRGCNVGLKKPLAILQDMVYELRINVSEDDMTYPAQNLDPSLDQSLLSNTLLMESDHAGASMSEITPQTAGPAGDSSFMMPDYPCDELGQPFASISMGGLDFLSEQEIDISHDALYGLFAPTQHFS